MDKRNHDLLIEAMQSTVRNNNPGEEDETVRILLSFANSLPLPSRIEAYIASGASAAMVAACMKNDADDTDGIEDAIAAAN